MLNRSLMATGWLAPLLYVGAVVLGGLLWPDYRHLAQPVSDLMAEGAPSKSVLDLLMVLYNLLTAAFAWGLWRLAGGHPAGRLGAALLMSEAVAGLLTLAFPEGHGGAQSPIDASGAAHITLAAVSSITSVLSILLLGRWLASVTPHAWLRSCAMLLVGFILLAGVAAVTGIAQGAPWGGLAERLTIGGFLLWLVVAAVTCTSLVRRNVTSGP